MALLLLCLPSGTFKREAKNVWLILCLGVRERSSEDALLLGFEWWLLLPTRSARGTLEWGDAILLAKPREMCKMPNVIKYLVQEAIETGRWDPEDAVAKNFKFMGESRWEKMPKLVQKFGEESKDYKITAIQIKKICRELDLEDKVDPLIA